MAQTFLAAVEGEVAEAALEPGVVRAGGGGLDALHERPAALRARLDAAEVEESTQVDVPGRAVVIQWRRGLRHNLASCELRNHFLLWPVIENSSLRGGETEPIFGPQL